MQARLGDVKLLRGDNPAQLDQVSSELVSSSHEKETTASLSNLQQMAHRISSLGSPSETQSVLGEMDALISGLGEWQAKRKCTEAINDYSDTEIINNNSQGAEEIPIDTVPKISDADEAQLHSESMQSPVALVQHTPGRRCTAVGSTLGNRPKNALALDDDVLKQLTSGVRVWFVLNLS
jgi:hypothetical protein